ncbi:MAG: phage holin, lambda family [Neptuniibacter sp.]
MPFTLKEIIEGATQPGIMGAMLAMVMAVLRVIYDRQETSMVRIVLEALLCGFLCLTAHAGITAAGLNNDWTLFVGGTIGYFGSTQVKLIAYKALNKRI